MPWIETCKMNQRKEFALRAMQSGNFRELCREYGISPKTGYKWKQRFIEHGLDGLEEHSRRPKSSPSQLEETMVCELIDIKHRHPHWGPEKIHDIYLRRHGRNQTPSLSSVKRVLDKAGLIKKRVRRKHSGRIHSGKKAEAANEVWTVDFKGWWRDTSGQRCEPLTVRDEYSRYLLEIERTADGRSDTIRRSFERLFDRYGMPGAIRSDNGPPFASANSIMGLSRLSAWWLVLGIDLERGRPGCPQDNGGHERMHRDIQRELANGPSDQASFDQWRQVFNHERPHQALGNRLPGEVYEKSKRSYLGTPEDLTYEGMMPRKVSRHGQIHLGGEAIFLGRVLKGWSVGLKYDPNTKNELIYFGNLLLGSIDPATSVFLSTDRTIKLMMKPTNRSVT